MRIAVLGHTYIVAANRGKFRHLAEGGHRILLASPREWLEPDFGLRRFEETDRLESALFDCPHHGMVRRFYYPWRELSRRIRDWRPDILLAETEPGGLAALQAAQLAISYGLPLATFAWENLPLTTRSRWAALPVYWATRRLLAGSTGAVRTARRAGYHGPTTVIPQVGIDPAALPAALPDGGARRRSRRKTVLFVARLQRKKGADLLLDALREAKDWSATIVGDGDERMALEAQAARLGLSDRVVFAGAVSHREVPSFYESADAFVLPSRSVPGWIEQFGHVLAWAMAAGVPVVASRCGAIPEVVGDAGLLVEENDAAGLAHALSQLADTGTAERCATRGRNRALQLFTEQALAARLERALTMALTRDRTNVLP